MFINIIKIIQLLAFFYPVALSVLSQIRQPIALVVPNAAQIQPLVQALSAEKNVLTEQTGTNEMLSTIKTASISPVVFVGRNTDVLPARCERNWQCVIEAAKLSVIDGHTLNTQILIVCEKRLPECFQEDCFVIYIEDYNPSETVPSLNLSKYKGLTLPPRLVESVLAKCRNESDELHAMDFVIELKHLVNPDVQPLLDAAYCLVQYEEELQDKGGLLDLFQAALYDFVKARHFIEIYDLPNVETSVYERMGEVFFYDSTHLYMSEQLFKQVTADLARIFPMNIIKETLAKNGVLEGGKSRFAVKMQYVTPFGETRRASMLRFNRMGLTPLGELDIVDIVVNEKEEKKW